MKLRPRRIMAVAQRDLARELKGRRGWVLPAVIAGLMLPVSGAPFLTLSGRTQAAEIRVAGSVPSEILDIESVIVAPEAPHLIFRRTPYGIEVQGTPIPSPIRQVLDGDDDNPIQQVLVSRSLPMPNRSLLLALLSASTLTGAVSSSIGGERQAGTLGALLTAGVTRAEVVLGKFAAWGGLGAATAAIAAVVAMALGRLELGWWILPLISVAPGAVALGLWLVRSASDVIGGTMVSLRVIPAVVATGGIASWFIGLDNPLLGAAVPIGGALVAAGSTWGTEATPALVSTASTGVLSLVLLASTWRSLDETVGRPAAPTANVLTHRTMVFGCMAWWATVAGPVLWSAAGNPVLYETLPRWTGVLAGSLCLLLMSIIAKTREGPDATQSAIPVPRALWVAACIVGMALFWIPDLSIPTAGHGSLVQLRLQDAAHPIWAGPMVWILALFVDEWMFRGWLQQSVGPFRATAAWVLIKFPLDPVSGLVQGAALAGLSHKGNWWVSATARVVLGLCLTQGG